jgi:GTPase SAR1 family protein
VPRAHLLSFQIPTERGAKYAKSVGALFSETSAKTGVNVQELFTEISKSLFGSSWHFYTILSFLYFCQ